MAVTAQKPTVFNPHGKKRGRAKTAAAKRKNGAGFLAALGSINPHKGKKPMAQKKTKAKTASKKPTASKPRAKNPFFGKTAPKRHKPRSSNPEGMKPMQMAKDGLSILSGLLIARQAPQLVLGPSNTGIVGYGSNLAVSVVGGLLVGMAVGTRTGFQFAAGGVAYTISRVATEQLSPIGKYFSLAGVGDAGAASMGDVRRSGVGIVVEDSFSNPQLTTANGQILIPPHIQSFVANQLAARPVQAEPSSVGRFSR